LRLVLAACTLAAVDLFERLFSASVLSSAFFTGGLQKTD